MIDLSIIIPARNEEWLSQTIDDIFKHSEAKIEVLVGFDGWRTELKKRTNLRVFYESESQGQRATQNALIRQSDAKYIFKSDAHCSFSQGFDRVMLEIMESNPDIVLVPALGNLHVYNYICPLGHKSYQGSKRCEIGPHEGDCDLTKELVWKIKPNPLYSDFYFDKDLIFQFGDVENYEMLHEAKAIQGSGFMVSRDNYWKWNLCDENWGSWGQQGFEVYAKTIKNGGKVLCTRAAFMGHFFRKIDEFPYERNMKQVDFAYQKSKELANEKNL